MEIKCNQIWILSISKYKSYLFLFIPTWLMHLYFKLTLYKCKFVLAGQFQGCFSYARYLNCISKTQKYFIFFYKGLYINSNSIEYQTKSRILFKSINKHRQEANIQVMYKSQQVLQSKWDVMSMFCKST